MAKEDEDTIELDLDQPEKKVEGKTEKAVTPEPVEAAPVSPTPEEALAALKKQLEGKDAQIAAEAARRAEAERTANKAFEQANKAQTDARSSKLDMVVSAIDSVKREQEILEANLAAAYSGGDFASAAKIQTAISTAAARLVSLEAGKEAMEAEAKNPIPVQKMERPADPVEALASQLSPRSAQWVRAHPDYARDQRLQQRMVAAHNLAVTDSLVPDTDAYFEHVEKTLGLRKEITPEPEEEALSEAAAPAARRASPAAAPVSRSGTGNGKTPNRVTLTAEEREVAALNGMSDREYAEQKLKLMKEGKIH